MIFAHWAFQQIKRLEAWNFGQVRIALSPHLLETLFEAKCDLESIHGNEHLAISHKLIKSNNKKVCSAIIAQVV